MAIFDSNLYIRGYKYTMSPLNCMQQSGQSHGLSISTVETMRPAGVPDLVQIRAERLLPGYLMTVRVGGLAAQKLKDTFGYCNHCLIMDV